MIAISLRYSVLTVTAVTLVTGCGSFFAGRVIDHDAAIKKIEADIDDMESERDRLEVDPSPDASMRVDVVTSRLVKAGDALAREVAARDVALDRVAEESRHRREILASILLIGGNALSFIVSMAKKRSVL